MITKMRPRYYCEHCKKGSGSPSYMKRHEAACTLNPNRICRMHGRPTLSRDRLTEIMNAEGFPAMCKAADECPACILSVVRQLNSFGELGESIVIGPQDGRQEWSYAEAKKKWWEAVNASREETMFDYY